MRSAMFRWFHLLVETEAFQFIRSMRCRHDDRIRFIAGRIFANARRALSHWLAIRIGRNIGCPRAGSGASQREGRLPCRSGMRWFGSRGSTPQSMFFEASWLREYWLSESIRSKALAVCCRLGIGQFHLLAGDASLFPMDSESFLVSIQEVICSSLELRCVLNFGIPTRGAILLPMKCRTFVGK